MILYLDFHVFLYPLVERTFILAVCVCSRRDVIDIYGRFSTERHYGHAGVILVHGEVAEDVLDKVEHRGPSLAWYTARSVQNKDQVHLSSCVVAAVEFSQYVMTLLHASKQVSCK